MLLKDLQYKLEGYKRIPKRKQNKAMMADIKIIPTRKSAHQAYIKEGLSQTYKQYTRLVEEDKYFKKNKSRFKLKNEVKLTKERVVYYDLKEEKEINLPKGKTVQVYTQTYREGDIGTSTIRILEVAYLVDDELFVLG